MRGEGILPSLLRLERAPTRHTTQNSRLGMESLHQQKTATKEFLAEQLGELGSRQMIVAVKSPASFSLPSGSATGSFKGLHPEQIPAPALHSATSEFCLQTAARRRFKCPVHARRHPWHHASRLEKVGIRLTADGSASPRNQAPSRPSPKGWNCRRRPSSCPLTKRTQNRQILPQIVNFH